MGVERGRQIQYHLGNIPGYSAIIVRYPADQVTILVLSNNERVDTWLIQTILSKRIFGEK